MKRDGADGGGEDGSGRVWMEARGGVRQPKAT